MEAHFLGKTLWVHQKLFLFLRWKLMNNIQSNVIFSTEIHGHLQYNEFFLLKMQATKTQRKPAPAVLLASEMVLDSCNVQNENAKASLWASEEDKKLFPKNVIFPRVIFWNYPWRVLSCLTKCMSKLPHPFAAQCLHPLLSVKLLLDFQVFLAPLPAWQPNCHQGGMLVGKGWEQCGLSEIWHQRVYLCTAVVENLVAERACPQGLRLAGVWCSPPSLGGLCHNQIPLVPWGFIVDKCRSESWV